MRTELLRERYEPLEVVGRGGEAEVIRALDHLHGRQVALKVRRAADETSRSHLLSEARLLLSLSPHPGLPLVREDFFADERYVIAMDWIEGTDLEALLDARRPPRARPGARDRLSRTGGRGAGAPSHSRPTRRPRRRQAGQPDPHLAGRVVLVDFGLSSTPTDDLRRAGTAGYVAPEVAAGARPTPASDVYSFASTAVALLAGEPPSGGRAELGRDRARADPGARANRAREPGRRSGATRCIGCSLRRSAAAMVGRGAP